MIWWLTFGPYGLIGLLLWRLIAGHLAYRMMEIGRQEYPHSQGRTRVPTGEQWLGAIVGAFVIACVWPLGLLFFIRSPLAIGSEARARSGEKDRRIRELERQLELS